MTLSYRHLAALSLLSLAACAAEGNADQDSSSADVSSVKAYYADAKKLDLSDLTRVSVGFAADGLNSALHTGGTLHAGLKVEPPAVFAETADPNLVLPSSMQVQGLDKIVGGLSATFGETELGTEVNKVRLSHLQTSNDKYFVESAFSTSVGIGPQWSFNANGFANTGVSLGFNADAQLTSRVIVATEDQSLQSIISAPVDAMKDLRGFIYPRSMADVRSMKPGEMFALRGAGQIGANFGVGAPVFVASPAGPLGYEIVVSAGVAGVVSGTVDVQLVRLDGDEIVVDVGVEKGKGVSFHAGIADEFGIKGICEDGQKCLRAVQIAGKNVGLDKLVEKAVVNQVNKYLTFSVAYDQSNTDSRISLSRFRIHMDQGNQDETEKALQQLLKFDLRLAQALYNRDLDQSKPAITADFDAVRAATTSSRNFGFELLGMNIYNHAVVERQGTFTLQTPDGAKSVLFETLHKDGGWFDSKHGFSRTGVGADSVTANGTIKSEANLFIETKNSDVHMNNDFASDNVDAFLLGLGRKDVVDLLDQYGNNLERKMWATCPLQDRNAGDSSKQGQHDYYWTEDCNVKLLDDPDFQAMRTDGLAAIDAKIANLPADMQAIVHHAADIRLKLQSVGIHDYDALNGCSVAWTSSVRFDDQSLSILASKSKDQYLAALAQYVGAVNATRRNVHSAADVTAVATKAQHDDAKGFDKMATAFVNGTQAYSAIVAAEKGLPGMLGNKKFISHPLAIRFTVDDDDSKMMESAQLLSTSTDRAHAATALYDNLRSAAGSVSADLADEQAAFYPLMALVPSQNLEAAFTLDTKIDSNFFVSRKRFSKVGLNSETDTAKGSSSSTIDGGMFDLKTMIDANP
jgi:hypothetical protein